MTRQYIDDYLRENQIIIKDSIDISDMDLLDRFCPHRCRCCMCHQNLSGKIWKTELSWKFHLAFQSTNVKSVLHTRQQPSLLNHLRNLFIFTRLTGRTLMRASFSLRQFFYASVASFNGAFFSCIGGVSMQKKAAIMALPRHFLSHNNIHDTSRYINLF